MSGTLESLSALWWKVAWVGNKPSWSHDGSMKLQECKGKSIPGCTLKQLEMWKNFMGSHTTSFSHPFTKWRMEKCKIIPSKMERENGEPQFYVSGAHRGGISAKRAAIPDNIHFISHHSWQGLRFPYWASSVISSCIQPEWKQVIVNPRALPNMTTTQQLLGQSHSQPCVSQWDHLFKPQQCKPTKLFFFSQDNFAGLGIISLNQWRIITIARESVLRYGDQNRILYRKRTINSYPALSCTELLSSGAATYFPNSMNPGFIHFYWHLNKCFFQIQIHILVMTYGTILPTGSLSMPHDA